MDVKSSAESVNMETPKEEHAYRWPLSYMKKEEYKKGDLLFKAGDKADKMFYVKKGSLRIVEIDKVIKEGDVIGEMGVFSPFGERTASAICEADSEVYTMGRDEAIECFSRDPNLAMDLIQLSIKRFIENLRVETEARERIESELRIARQIQMSMLPREFPPFPERKEFELFAMVDPAKEVGGDFYDFFFVDKYTLCLFIGDVSGKGVPAALFMATSKTLLRTEALRGLSCDEILTRVNNTLCPDNQTCMFVTVFCLMLNIETGEIQFSNAGHNPPLISTSGRPFEFVDVPTGFVLGAMENIKCEGRRWMLKPNDIVFLYTDGVTEAMNPQTQLFSEPRLRSCLSNLRDRDVTELIHGVNQEIRTFARGAPQSDDIAMLALRFQGKG